MKPYDIVLEDTLEEMIEVTNEAVLFGYHPVGGWSHFQNKFIQSIYKPLKPKTMNKDFLEQLLEFLPENDKLKMTIQRTGETLTFLITVNDKNPMSGSGTPAALTQDLIPHIKAEKEKGTFTFNVLDAETEESKDDADEESQKEKKSAAKKEAAKKAVKTPAPKAEVKKPAAAEVTAAEEEITDVDFEELPNADENANVEKESAPKADNMKRVFDAAMTKGAELYKAAKYADAMAAYKSALDIYPDDVQAKKDFQMSEKWVNAMKNADL